MFSRVRTRLFTHEPGNIVRKIRTEELEPGARLPPEAEMLKEYGIGRGSLREALRILEVNGLIWLKPGPGGGPVVGGPQAEHFGRWRRCTTTGTSKTDDDAEYLRTTGDFHRLVARRHTT